jgi:hypothetical protein
VYGGCLALQGVGSSVAESGRSRSQGVDGLSGEKDGVTGGLGELLDAGSDVDGVPDQSELEFVVFRCESLATAFGVDARPHPVQRESWMIRNDTSRSSSAPKDDAVIK